LKVYGISNKSSLFTGTTGCNNAGALTISKLNAWHWCGKKTKSEPRTKGGGRPDSRADNALFRDPDITLKAKVNNTLKNPMGHIH
jgi:hypothetical protein